MSFSRFKIWEPPQKNLRGREISFINSTYQAHDTFCGCDDPAVHILGLLFYPMGPFDDNNLQKAIEKLKAKKCLTFGETAGTARDTDIETHTEGAVDLLENVNSEELENIFAGDAEENLDAAIG